MAKKKSARKKGSRIVVGLQCTESGAMNYITKINKANTDLKSFRIKKYSPSLRKVTVHKVKEKLKGSK